MAPVAVPVAADSADWPSLIETKETAPRKKRTSEAGASSSSPPGSEKADGGAAAGGAAGGGSKSKGARKVALSALPGPDVPAGGRANGSARPASAGNPSAGGRGGRGSAVASSSRRSGDGAPASFKDAASDAGSTAGSASGRASSASGRGGLGGRGAAASTGGRGAAAAFPGAPAAAASAAAAAGNPYAYGYSTNLFYNPAAFSVAGGAAKSAVLESLRLQIEYYFSVDNLCRDIFLRSKMDDNGYISVAVIASFNRVRMLTPDISLIVEALRASSVVQFSPDESMLRARENPLQWVLPLAQREAMAAQSTSPKGVPAGAAAAAPPPPPAAPAAVPPPPAAPAAAPMADAKPEPAPAVKAEPAPAAPASSSGVLLMATPVKEEPKDDEDDLFELDEVRALLTGCLLLAMLVIQCSVALPSWCGAGLDRHCLHLYPSLQQNACLHSPAMLACHFLPFACADAALPALSLPAGAAREGDRQG